jgi:unsaturated rhamnogalacturonyl hydrolase
MLSRNRLFVSVAALVMIPTLLAHGSSTNAPTPEVLVRTVADRVLLDFPQPLPFDWGEGVLLSGMLQAHRMTKDPRYLEFVRRFAEHWSQRGIGPLLNAKGYCGHWGPGAALIELHQMTKDDQPLRLADDIVEFIMHRATRTHDGGLDHFSGKPELWVDTLAMCCPVLAHKARLADHPQFQAEARRQLAVFAQHLQDPVTGLFYHYWSETTGQRTTNFWARGNGWMAMALVETLKNERLDTPARKTLRDMLEKQLSSILKAQDPTTGLWHTLLEDPDSHLETSASAMLLYAMTEANRLKCGTWPTSALGASWRGLVGQVDAVGHVIGVSGGTTPGPKTRYTNMPTGTYTWGTGAFLLAASAWSQTDWNVDHHQNPPVEDRVHSAPSVLRSVSALRSSGVPTRQPVRPALISANRAPHDSPR